MTDKVQDAFAVLKQAMIDDGEGEQGGYAHSWHCNIAMMCYNAIQVGADEIPHERALLIGNEAATRFMKLCFDVDTEA